MTTTATPVTEIPKLRHREAMALAATEYDRTLGLVRSLKPHDWSAHVADCPEWDVRALVAHELGAAESFATMREGMRQDRAARKAATDRGMAYIDAWTALQVEAREGLDHQALLRAVEDAFPRALRGRRRTPAPVRAFPMKFPEPIGRRMPMGYLIDTIGVRDVWMHRVDVSRATGRGLVLTPDHDGRIVADVVGEWARLHGKPFRLLLRGPGGGEYGHGEGGDEIEIDAVEFCRILSGRGTGEGLLSQQVPF